MKQYVIRSKKDKGVSADAWDKAPDVWRWAVFGPCPPFAYGEIVALFLTREDAESFAKAMNPSGCPFCNATSEEPEVMWEGSSVFVRCGSCHAQGPAIGKGRGRVSREYLINEAVAGWNLGART